MTELSWPEVTLEDVATDVTVGFVGTMAHEYVANGVPFLRSLNVEPFRINANDLKFISPSFHKQIRKSALAPGDVVIVRTGKPGACAVVPEWLSDANCSDLVVVRPGPTVLPRYLCYVINSVASHHVEAFTVGAVQQHFNVGAARKIRFRRPSLREQDRIVALLGALDDKIELNRRMNETLEGMARAIFQDWFVAFGPTRAKMEGRPPYLAPDLRALFPDRLDAEGKPEGWEASTIGEEVTVVGGTTPSTKEPAYWNGDLHWATPKDLSTLAVPVLLDTERRITAKGLSQIGSGLLPAGSVLLSSRAPIGYLAVNLVPTAINQGFIGMVCEKRLSNMFVWLWTKANMEAILQKANGSTFQEISKSNFRPIPVVVPGTGALGAFEAAVRPLWDRLCANVREQGSLAATRDLLLPRLMSGELRVKDAERAVEEAA